MGADIAVGSVAGNGFAVARGVGDGFGSTVAVVIGFAVLVGISDSSSLVWSCGPQANTDTNMVSKNVIQTRIFRWEHIVGSKHRSSTKWPILLHDNASGLVSSVNGRLLWKVCHDRIDHCASAKTQPATPP